MARKNHNQCESPCQTIHRRICRLYRSFSLINVIAYQMNYDFGVGLCFKFSTITLQLFFKFRVILNYTVMDNRHLIRRMRVGITLIRQSMCGPACMTDAYSSLNRVVFHFTRKINQFTFCTAAINMTIGQACYTRGIIPAIFQTL